MHEDRQSFWVRSGLGVTCLVMALLTTMAQHSQAQQKTGLPASLQQRYEFHLENASLETITQTLMKTGHISILVDGEPLRKEDSLKLEGTLAETLDQVATDFDYRWKLTKSGIVLMTKRFTKPAERPQLNLPEMRQMALEMDQVLNTLPGEPSPVYRLASILQELMGSLNATQRQALNTGGKLRNADIDPGQAQLLGQALLASAFDGDRAAVRELKAWLGALPLCNLSAKQYSNLPPEEEPLYDMLLTAHDPQGKPLLLSFRKSRVKIINNTGSKGKRDAPKQ